MRKIERTTGFKKDFKRESKGQYRAILDEELHAVLSSLVNDCPLDARYRDVIFISDVHEFQKLISLASAMFLIVLN